MGDYNIDMWKFRKRMSIRFLLIWTRGRVEQRRRKHDILGMSQACSEVVELVIIIQYARTRCGLILRRNKKQDFSTVGIKNGVSIPSRSFCRKHALED